MRNIMLFYPILFLIIIINILYSMVGCKKDNCICNGCDENCCKQAVNGHGGVEDGYEYEHGSDGEGIDVNKRDERHYPNTSKDALPSAIKVQELFNMLDHALYRAFNEYKPTYGEMFIALFQLQQKLYTLYMRDIARSSMELIRMEMLNMVRHDGNNDCSKLGIYT